MFYFFRLRLKDMDFREHPNDQCLIEYLDQIKYRYIGIEKLMKDIIVVLTDVNKFVESYIEQSET